MLRRLTIVALFLLAAAIAYVELASRRAPADAPVTAAPAARPAQSAPAGPENPPTLALGEPGGALPGTATAAPQATPPEAQPAAPGSRVAFEPAEDAARRARERIATAPEVRDVTPPSPPSDLVAESDGPAMRLRWPDAADDVGVERYEVLRDGQVFVSTSSPSAVDEAAPPLQRLCYTVVALDAAGNRSRPSRSACATLADLVPPTAPTTVQARPTSETSVALSWSGAADAGGIVSYDVVRAGIVVATADSPRSAESGLLAGRTYCWVVRARDAAGNVSKDSPEACATVRDQTPPAPPPAFVAAPASPDRVAFAWQPAIDNVGVDRYEVLRDGRVVASTGGAKVSGVEAGLAPSTSYCFSVVAVDAAGNRSRPSSPACARTADPGTPAGPTELALAASPRSASAVVLRWDPSPEPGVVYTVYWDGNKRIGATPRNEYTVVGLKAGERRCFRVSAVDAAGKESPSSLETCLAGAPRK